MVKRKVRVPEAAREPRDVRVKVDAGLKKRYDALAVVMHEAKKRGSSAFDALWEAVGEIVEHAPPLYVVAGHKDAAEFFREELGETRRNAFRYIRVAKFASPRDEERYGTTKLDAALSYIEAKLGAPLVHPPLPIAFDRLRIPVRRAAVSAPRSVSLEDARVEDVIAATRGLKTRAAKPTSSVERAIKESLAKGGPFEDVRVRVRGGLIDFSHVPTAAFTAFLRALAGVEWETPAEQRTAKASRARRGKPKGKRG